VNQKTWTAEDRDEFDRICYESEAEGESTGERAQFMGDKIDDAVQAHRVFARDAHREALTRGYLSIFKGWQKSQQKPVVVAHDGQLLNKPRVIGTNRARDDGSVYYQQTMFDFMTWEELAKKRYEYLTQIRAYRGNVATVDKLLALRELAPNANTPAQAAEVVGTTLEAWLGEEAA
jgi:hypothetical protein